MTLDLVMVAMATLAAGLSCGVIVNSRAERKNWADWVAQLLARNAELATRLIDLTAVKMTPEGSRAWAAQRARGLTPVRQDLEDEREQPKAPEGSVIEFTVGPDAFAGMEEAVSSTPPGVAVHD